MNRHLTPYLTNSNPLLREWVRERINREDRVYQVIEDDIAYIPGENIYVNGAITLGYREFDRITREVLYCRELYCRYNELEELPELPEGSFIL